MDTPPPPPLPPNQPLPAVPPPVPPAYPAAPPPPPPPPPAGAPPPMQGMPPHNPHQPPATDRVMQVIQKVDWKQLASDCRMFAGRFFTGDFGLIKPAPGETVAVAGHTERMASLIVWRRALLFMAAVLAVVMVVKSCFKPHTFRSMQVEQTVEALEKLDPSTSSEDRHRAAEEQVEASIKRYGEANIVVANTLLVGDWLTIIASSALLVMAAQRWREWRKSRKLALMSVAVVLLPKLGAMVFPWSTLMNFGHLVHTEVPGVPDISPVTAVRLELQGMIAYLLLATALPFFYGLFNGVLRATLTAKTLIPASIVCGWSTLLMALTISVPWFLVLSIVSQFQADALIITGVICLVAAPLSLLFKCRRLGAPLTPAEATPVVKRARHFFTGLNIGGIVLIAAYLNEKDALTADALITSVIHYFGQLMLIMVVAVDMLVLLLDRAHRKLANDESPDEALRQLGEVLPPAIPPPLHSIV